MPPKTHCFGRGLSVPVDIRGADEVRVRIRGKAPPVQGKAFFADAVLGEPAEANDAVAHLLSHPYPPTAPWSSVDLAPSLVECGNDVLHRHAGLDVVHGSENEPAGAKGLLRAFLPPDAPPLRCRAPGRSACRPRRPRMKCCFPYFRLSSCVSIPAHVIWMGLSTSIPFRSGRGSPARRRRTYERTPLRACVP